MLIIAKRKNLILLIKNKYTAVSHENPIEVPDADGYKLIEKYGHCIEQVQVLAPPPKKKKVILESDTKEIGNGPQL